MEGHQCWIKGQQRQLLPDSEALQDLGLVKQTKYTVPGWADRGNGLSAGQAFHFIKNRMLIVNKMYKTIKEIKLLFRKCRGSGWGWLPDRSGKVILGMMPEKAPGAEAGHS